MHVGSPGKKSKTEARYFPARVSAYGDGDTSDMVLDCGGTVSFTQSFVYLDSLLRCDLSSRRGVGAHIKKAAHAFGALRGRVFSYHDVPERLKGKVYARASSRCCCTAASHGASRQRPSRACVAGTTSVFARSVGSPCVIHLFIESLR
jgi:hypothetical protein